MPGNRFGKKPMKKIPWIALVIIWFSDGVNWKEEEVSFLSRALICWSELNYVDITNEHIHNNQSDANKNIQNWLALYNT